MDATALLGIAGLILIKEIGVPVPVPGDLVVIGAGVAAASGQLDPPTALGALVIASIVGGTVQFGLLRSVARPAVIRLLGRLGGTERIDRQAARLRARGAGGVALARMTPGVRIVAIAASALAAVPAPAFLAGLVVGNGLFIAAHFGLGFLLGEPILAVVSGALGPIAIGAIVLAVLGGIGWAVVARTRGRGADLPEVAAWADACCPACLAAAVATA